MRRILALMASFLLLVGSSFAAPPVFKWTKVAGDPCNPKAGCTLEWALSETEWPADVRLGLLAKVKAEKPAVITITSGLGKNGGFAWRGWMTWGKYKPKFKPNVVAAWPDGKQEPASLWSYDQGTVRHFLIKVRKCGNWGGWTEGIIAPAPLENPPVATVVVPKAPDLMPLGTPPIMACPDEE